MGMIVEAGKNSKSLKNVIDYLKYKFKFASEHPDYFDADGLLVFVGSQGTGKTLSAVNYVYNLMEMYPNCILVTNLLLTGYEFDYKRVFPFKDNDDLMKYSNGEQGVIFLIDEIQLYLNSLESKNVNMEVMTQIAQQRKQRKHIVTTSQVFGRMAKPLREQFSNVIVCKNFLGCVQINKLVDRDSLESDNSTSTDITGKVKKTFFWFHSPKMYGRYDTYYVIERGKFVSGEDKKGDIYARDSQSTDNN